jgi:hypothetical protein
MNVRQKHSGSSRNRHPRIEPLEARLALSADLGGYDIFGPAPLFDQVEALGARPVFAEWSQEPFADLRDRGDNVTAAEDFVLQLLSQRSAVERRPIAALWQPSTNTLYVLFAPSAEPFDEQPVPTPNGGGPLRSRLLSPSPDRALSRDPIGVRAPGEAGAPLSLAALELLGTEVELTTHFVPAAEAAQPPVLSTALARPAVETTAQLIAAATPGFENAAVARSLNEPLSARDAAYANSAETQWLEITREEAAQVQKLLDANRLPHEAIATADDEGEPSAPELRPEDYLAAEWVNDLVLLAAANSADDAELFLALSGKPAEVQTATKVALSVASSTPQAEPVAAAVETLTPSRTLRWCGAVLAPVLFAAAIRDRVKRKAANGVGR